MQLVYIEDRTYPMVEDRSRFNVHFCDHTIFMKYLLLLKNREEKGEKKKKKRKEKRKRINTNNNAIKIIASQVFAPRENILRIKMNTQ